jgi:hypothetical protein
VVDSTCWGIFRESAHSPGRESDDAEILGLTAKHLEARGFDVTLKTVDDVTAGVSLPPRFVFLMCETAPVIAELLRWEATGVRHVNSPAAVMNTYRQRMIAVLDEANVPFIASRTVSTAAAITDAAGPVWVKRSDVHNTQPGDVVFAPTPAVLADALRALADRGMTAAILQPHLDGDLVKFYGIGHAARDGAPSWFQWFYPKEEFHAGHPFDAKALARLARRAATALGLEIYGGDAIVTPAGDTILIDLNAWPSFALYRDEASRIIAAHLALRFESARR